MPNGCEYDRAYECATGHAGSPPRYQVECGGVLLEVELRRAGTDALETRCVCERHTRQLSALGGLVLAFESERCAHPEDCAPTAANL